MSEQKERLENFCKFKGYEIIDYYQDAGISAKTGNHRPEFERLKKDIKSKRINTIVALKLDRITRSIYDWENLITFLDENDIKKRGEGKDYIIVDWVFLPLCDWSKHCDETICVVANHDLRLERLTKRLQDKSIYNEGDRSFWSYKERNY